jgi:hypothetical protein
MLRAPLVGIELSESAIVVSWSGMFGHSQLSYIFACCLPQTCKSKLSGGITVMVTCRCIFVFLNGLISLDSKDVQLFWTESSQILALLLAYGFPNHG